MKTKVLLSAFLLCSVLISYGQWTYTNLSEPKNMMGVATVGTQVYFAGGHNGTNTLSGVESFDMQTGTWATAGNISISRQGISATSCGSKLYFGGGVSSDMNTVYSTVDIYNTATSQWSTGQLSIARFDIAAVSNGNKVLFAGGCNYNIICTKVVDIYDNTSGIWSIANLSLARAGMAYAVVGDLAIFAGGFITGGGVSQRVDIYNFTTNTWSTANLSQARVWASAVTVGDKVVIAGGIKSFPDVPSDRVDIFNSTDGTWTTAVLSEPRAWLTAGAVNGRAFFAGGSNVANGGIAYNYSDVIDIYDLASNSWSIALLDQPRDSQGLAIGDHFLVAGGTSDDGLLSSVEIYHDPTLIHVPFDHSTIQQGINASSDGDTVLVAENTYFENINFYGKAILLASDFILDGDTSHISSTIINGSQPTFPDIGSVVTFGSGEDTTSVLCGFTITGGTGTFVPDAGNAIAGGGVFIQYSGGKLLNNYIEYNSANNQGWAIGGGVCAGGPIPILPWVVMRGNRVMHNEAISEADAGEGGGIDCFYNLIMKGNQISYNSANGHLGANGGGVSIAASFSPIILDIRENNISHNEAITDMGSSAYAALGAGLGIYFDVSGTISNNDISNNSIDAPGTYWSWGPGVFIQDITSNGFVFENNFIKENHANTTQFCRGGGLSLLRSGGTYQNNVIQDNSASYGGGISIIDAIEVSDTVILINNTVTDNEATFGGGLYSYSSDAIVLNSVFWGNTASQGPSIFRTLSTIDVRYSDVQNSTVWPGEANINVDPQFLDDGYHLSPQSQLQNVAVSKINLNGTTYSCPDFDIDNNTRAGLNNPPDMGADEVDMYLSDGEAKQVKGLVLNLFPNPFTHSVTIGYTIEKAGPVLLQVFDSFGRLVAEPLNSYQTKGEQKIEWNAENLPAGVYFCRLQAGNKVVTNKIVKMH